MRRYCSYFYPSGAKLAREPNPSATRRSFPPGKSGPLHVGLILFLLSIVLAQSSRGEYLTPQEAGFRNCALIYYNQNYDAEAFKPILVKYVDGKPTEQAGYDAFLFLLHTVNGKSTLGGETNLADWREQIDIFFHRDINAPALARASKELRADGLLQERIKVVFSIPWPHPNMRDFGDVDGDGKTENLGVPEDLEKALAWYIRLVSDEMKAYPELDLWGFYMMNEGILPQNRDLARRFCGVIHEHGLRALWIPFYNAPGVDVADELGFDVTIMQSNWTFGTRFDGSGARRNRLVNAADWAKKHHQGIELEINPSEAPYWRDVFARSLETGTLTGFQQAVGATYFGDNFYWAVSNDADSKALYSLWMDYLAGKPIRLPQAGDWSQQTLPDGDVEIVYRFDKPTDVRLIDLFYRDIPDGGFTALTTVEGRANESEPWRPLGWKIGCLVQSELGPEENITVNFKPMTVWELRVLVHPLVAGVGARLVGAEPELAAEPLHVSKSFHKSYTTNKPAAPPTYPDESGRDLFDGTTGGSWKNYVGWTAKYPAEMNVDFGEPIVYDEIRLHLFEDLSASITWPRMIEAISSMTPGIQPDGGYGAPADNFDFTCGCGNRSGSNAAILKPVRPVTARAMTIRFKRRAWLFLSEVEFYREGKRLDPDKFSYRLSLQDYQTPNKEELYADNGSMLTDGYVSGIFGKGCVGMCSGATLRATVNLEQATRVNRVTCWLLDGQRGGVRTPLEGTLRLSTDGETWSEPLRFDMPPSRSLTSNEPVAVRLDPGQNAQYVQVEFRSEGWTFLSEIEVE